MRAELGCAPGDADALARLTAAEVVAAQERATPKLFGIAGLLPFHPALDDATVPTTPLVALRAGAAREVDLVLGVTTDEMRLFLEGPAIEPARLHKRAARYVGLDDDATSALLDSYRALLRDHGEPAEPIDVWAALYTDKEMLVPAIAALDAHASTGGRSFGYRFDWPARPRADGLELRACHGVDIPFTFASFAVDGWDRFVGADTDPRGAAALSAALRAAWCAFARTGEPAHEGIGAWPRFSTADRPMMRLGRACGAEPDPVADRLTVLAAAGISPAA
jgi:para-nitrobenzyl esterase